MNSLMKTTESGALPDRRTMRAAIERIHEECIRADPELRDARNLGPGRDGMVVRFDSIIRAFFQHLPKGRPMDGLEVGVGEGALVLALHEFISGVRWQGVDIPLRHATYQESFDAIMMRRSIPIVEADLTRNAIPFSDAMFDAVSFSELAEHLPANGVMPTLREIARVLRPKGIVVATSPNLVSLMNRVLLLLGKSPFHLPIAEDFHGCQTYPHIHLYTVSEFESLCRTAGLEPIAHEHLTYLTHAFFSDSPVRNTMLRAYLVAEALLGTVTPALKDGWLVAARKT
jgi:SAM-dependent methyltransferase